eukprot:1239156-Prorocentrum_lima.AAC.1
MMYPGLMRRTCVTLPGAGIMTATPASGLIICPGVELAQTVACGKRPAQIPSWALSQWVS